MTHRQTRREGREYSRPSVNGQLKLFTVHRTPQPAPHGAARPQLPRDTNAPARCRQRLRWRNQLARRRPFKIGLFVPHFELPWNGSTLRWAEIAALARRAEEIGFDSFWLPDHLLYRFPEVHPQGAWDAWSLLAALAATTRTMEIGPLVACSSFRNPALIAKMADTIDEISGGRLILGLGAGWHEPEYTAFGFHFDHRVSRFDEAMQIITALLRTGHVDFDGTHYTARDCELRPRGPRPKGPPILIGGSGPRMLRLAARYGDAWNADRQNDVATVQELNARVDAACNDEGRDPASLARIIGIQVDVLNASRQPTG